MALQKYSLILVIAILVKRTQPPVVLLSDNRFLAILVFKVCSLLLLPILFWTWPTHSCFSLKSLVHRGISATTLGYETTWDPIAQVVFIPNAICFSRIFEHIDNSNLHSNTTTRIFGNVRFNMFILKLFLAPAIFTWNSSVNNFSIHPTYFSDNAI